MLNNFLWFLLIVLPHVRSNITCNIINIPDTCWHDVQKQNRHALYEEAMRIAQCLVNNAQKYDNGSSTNGTEDRRTDSLEIAKCIVSVIEMGHQDVDKTESNNLTDRSELDSISVRTHEDLNECDCFVCSVARYRDVLIFRYSNPGCNDTCGLTEAEAQKTGEQFITDLKHISDIFMCVNVTDRSIHHWVQTFVDINNCDFHLDKRTEFEYLPTALTSKQVDTYFGIPIKQVGGAPGVVILSSIYITGFILNCILIRIFIRREEMRKGSTLIIINIAVADILNLILHNPPIDIFLVHSIHSPLSVTYVFYVIVGLNIYSVMMFSCHVYLTVLPVNNRRNSGWKILRRYSPHAHAITALLLASVAAIPLISVMDEYYTVSLYVLVTYCAFPLCFSTLFSVGTSLQLGSCVQNVHCGSSGHETERSFRSRNANTLVALIVVSAVSYVPYCCLPFIPPYIGEQPEDHPFLISWLFVWFNSFVNPIALYVANRDFRRSFNKYVCFCCCSGRD
ncbi:neuromedin-B receptor isoform X2 [Cryptotermes secundus]|nr:neuromedin-B receptor isoform X2 [Cryptotermes secundus]